jgi:nucleotide-binding universal stress UspA family protein
VLVATDFSEASERAVTLAVELARSPGSGLTVVHTCEVPVYAYTDMSFAPLDLLSPVVDVARERLGELMGRLAAVCPGAKSVLEVGVPWERILGVAAVTGADLIVMGTHGRRGVAHALLGSVAEKVVRLSPVPVLTVRAPSR